MPPATTTLPPLVGGEDLPEPSTVARDDTSVFPLAPPVGPFEVVIAVTTGLAVALLTIARVPMMVDSLWGEDAAVFLQQAMVTPLPENVLVPYAGYHHVLPRVIAMVASWAPPSLAAAVFSAGVLAVVAAGGALVELATGPYIRRRWIRIGVALAIAALPVLAAEVLGAAASLQWVMGYICFWALLWVPRGRWGQATVGLALVIGAASSILPVILVPLALLRLALCRTARWIPVLFATVALLHAAQGYRLADRSPATTGLGERFVEAVQGWNAGVLGNIRPGMRFGVPVNQDWPATFLPDHGGLMVVVLVLALVVLVAGFLRRPFDHRRGFVVGAGVLAALATWAFVLLFGHAWPRYCAMPALLLVGALGVLMDGALDRLPALAGGAAAGVITGFLVVSAVVAWTVPSYRADADEAPWRDGVADAWYRCRTGEGVVDGTLRVPALPEGWAAVIPCSALRG
jgi:hypothetical protein